MIAAARIQHLQANNLRHVAWYRPGLAHQDVKQTVAPKNNLVQKMNSIFPFKIIRLLKKDFIPK